MLVAQNFLQGLSFNIVYYKWLFIHYIYLNYTIHFCGHGTVAFT